MNHLLLNEVVEGYTDDERFGFKANFHDFSMTKEFLFKEHALMLLEYVCLRQAPI